MKPRVKVLSLAITLALAGCSSAPEKPSVEQGEKSTGQTVAPKAEAVSSTAPMPAPVAQPEPIVMSPAAVPVTASVATKPVPKRQLKLPANPNTFLITADTKTKEHPFFGRGNQLGFNINGVPGSEVVVTRDKSYKFVVDTGVQHDFYLTTSSAGWGAGTYTDGVEGQFIYQGEVSFAPSKATPDLLYYQCRNHKYMGGKIFVIDEGADVAKLKATLADSDADTAGGHRNTVVVTESGVKQKLGYAQMVMDSGSASRVEASGNAEAVGLLNNARQQIEMAKGSLAAGNLESAMTEVNEGLRLMTAASRAVTTETDISGVDQKAKFEELSSSLSNYEGSYKRNASKIKQTAEQTLDEGSFNRLMSEGEALAGKGDYAAANKKLSEATAMITTVLTNMLHAQTVTYDKSFESPKDEYEYELARTENYEELVPLGIEQKKPSERALELIDGFVEKAAKIKSEGQELAAKGDYKMAVMAMQAATSNLQRALRIAGVN